MTNAWETLNRKPVGRRPPEIPRHRWKEINMTPEKNTYDMD
jgi:hypothetical protein